MPGGSLCLWSWGTQIRGLTWASGIQKTQNSWQWATPEAFYRHSLPDPALRYSVEQTAKMGSGRQTYQEKQQNMESKRGRH